MERSKKTIYRNNNMTDYSEFLIRTDEQAGDFKARYGDYIESSSTQMEQWVKALPLGRWFEVGMDPKAAEGVIGLLCILYVDGRINVTFNRQATAIRRDPESLEEFWNMERAASFKVMPRKNGERTFR